MSLRRDETAALDLPLKMAVLTVVGAAGLAALLSSLPSCTVPAPLAAEVVSVDGEPGDTVTGSRTVQVGVRVTSKGGPVRDATAVLAGLGSAATNRSDPSGSATLLLDPLPAWTRLVGENREEGYLKLTASAPGCYQTFENEFALRVRVR